MTEDSVYICVSLWRTMNNDRSATVPDEPIWDNACLTNSLTYPNSSLDAPPNTRKVSVTRDINKRLLNQVYANMAASFFILITAVFYSVTTPNAYMCVFRTESLLLLFIGTRSFWSKGRGSFSYGKGGLKKLFSRGELKNSWVQRRFCCHRSMKWMAAHELRGKKKCQLRTLC